MFSFFRKPYRWAVTFTLLLALSVVYVLLDTFVLPRAIPPISGEISPTREGNVIPEQTENSNIVITDSTYKDSNIEITIEKLREYDTDIYIADIKVTDIEYLKTAFAYNKYGRNYKQTTSTIADENNAILAINGDFYGFRDYGFVLRNGVLYRDTPGGRGTEAMLINSSGDFSFAKEDDTILTAEEKLWQAFSFGPSLIDGGELTVTKDSKVNREMNSNPRTAIGQISELHYVFLVSDGRTEQSKGLSLYEMAQVLYDKGCTAAYNLDGGGSSTMVFNGVVINNPTDGRGMYEREVSDIVYIGY